MERKSNFKRIIRKFVLIMKFSTLKKEYKPGKDILFVKIDKKYHNKEMYTAILEEIGNETLILLIDLRVGENGMFPYYSLEKIDFELVEYLKRDFQKFLSDFLPFTTDKK